MNTQKLNTEQSTIFVNPITIDKKFLKFPTENCERNNESTLINPIAIDENVPEFSAENCEISNESTFVNPITIDEDHIARTTNRTQKELVNPIVIDDKFRERELEKKIIPALTSEPLKMCGISVATYDYIRKNNLSYDIVKLLNPQPENSIGGAKSLLSVLPEVAYDEKEKKSFYGTKAYGSTFRKLVSKKCV